MKIKDYKTGTTFEITCTKEHNCYNHFQIHKDLVHMYGKKQEDVITVKCTIIEEDVIVSDLYKYGSSYDANKVDYFGWIEFEDDGTYDIGLIYPNIKLYFMCFAYGPDARRFWNHDIDNHKKGDRRGMTVRLKIEEL